MAIGVVLNIIGFESLCWSNAFANSALIASHILQTHIMGRIVQFSEVAFLLVCFLLVSGFDDNNTLYFEDLYP